MRRVDHTKRFWIPHTQKSLASQPWIEPDAANWEQSYAIKYINYEAEPGHVNLDNPLQMTEVGERRMRSFKKSKSKKKGGKDGEFSVTEEGITEVVGRLIAWKVFSGRILRH